MRPESAGVPGNNLVLGKHSGRHALARRLSELGHPASGPELDFLYQRFMKLAESKKTIYDQDLLWLVPQMVGNNWQLAFSFFGRLAHSLVGPEIRSSPNCLFASCQLLIY